MAWTYADWPDSSIHTTEALQLAQLRKHLSEVQAKISMTTAGQGSSKDTSNLTNYLVGQREEERRLERRVNARTTGAITRTRAVRPR